MCSFLLCAAAIFISRSSSSPSVKGSPFFFSFGGAEDVEADVEMGTDADGLVEVVGLNDFAVGLSEKELTLVVRLDGWFD